MGPEDTLAAPGLGQGHVLAVETGTRIEMGVADGEGMLPTAAHQVDLGAIVETVICLVGGGTNPVPGESQFLGLRVHT